MEVYSQDDPSVAEEMIFSPLDIPLSSHSVLELKMGSYMGCFSHFRWQLQEAWRVLVPGGKLTLKILRKKAYFLPNPIWVKSRLCEILKHKSQKSYQFYSPQFFKSLLPELGYGVLSEKQKGLFETQFELTKPNETFLEWSERGLKNLSPQKFYAENIHSQKEIHTTDENGWNKHGELKEIFPEQLAGKNILILSPHPDDEIIGCGGLIIEGLAVGAKVKVIQMTDGSKSKSLQSFSAEKKKKLRLIESQKVSEHLGFEMEAWAHPQEDFSVADDLIKKLRIQLDNFCAQMVFVPCSQDRHPDHQTTSKLLAKALELKEIPGPTTEMDIYGYEIWSLSNANSSLDISASMEKKVAEIFNYKLAMRMENYVSKVLENNRYHALKLNKPLGFAEGYERMTAEAFMQLMADYPIEKTGEL